MPQSAAATRTKLTERSTNPTSNADPTIVTVTLKYKGVTYTPEAVYDALDAAYGTVATDKDANSRGNLHFTITP